MKVLITGADGFIGKNLCAQLGVLPGIEVLRYGRASTVSSLHAAIAAVDFICHLAGENRPADDGEFARVNTELTRTLCQAVELAGRSIPIIFASSVHAERNNSYGKSKLAAEQLLLHHANKTGTPVHIFRLPHVIGKWCRPNYNSVVATFCHNIARDLPIRVDDPDYPLSIVYIDDLVTAIVEILRGDSTRGQYCEVSPTYQTTVGALADLLRSFRESRETLLLGRVGVGLTRALYSTYVSYVPNEQFAYDLRRHEDQRGVFVEMLKTQDSGQVSYFTAHAGVTRGGHYHHSKSEKFLVIKGDARFRFRHMLTQEVYEIVTSGASPRIVETIPGWIHEITNVGDCEMIVLLWANEKFDRERPDTYLESV